MNKILISFRGLSAFFAILAAIYLTACAVPDSSMPSPAPGDPAGTAASASVSAPDESDGTTGAASVSAPDGSDGTTGAASVSAPDGPEGTTGAASVSAPDGSADLSSRAEEISKKYGLRILCGSDVRQTFRDYTAAALEDPGLLLDALDVLDRTLALYPPGFFASVREGFCESITICLAKDLHAIDDDTYLESAHAFTTVQDDTIWLVVNAREQVRPSTLIHELTHVTDYRLLGMDELHESEWNQLNPPSFSYYNAYLDGSGQDLRISGSREYTSLQEEDPDRIWFYDAYSRTYAMEDRARLMEKLLEDLPAGQSGLPQDRCFSSPHIQTKLRFYFYTLRQVFVNSGWPEQTVWEAALQSAVGEDQEALSGR